MSREALHHLCAAMSHVGRQSRYSWRSSCEERGRLQEELACGYDTHIGATCSSRHALPKGNGTPRKKPQKERPDIVSILLSLEAKGQLDRVCKHRGMSIKMFLGQLIEWFVDLNMTEQSIVLGQVEDQDVISLSEMIAHRKKRSK